MPNSIDFYKRIFLHVFHFRIIVHVQTGQKEVNNILKKHDRILKQEEKNVSYHHNNISAFHLHGHGLHLNLNGTTMSARNILSRICIFWCTAGSNIEIRLSNEHNGNKISLDNKYSINDNEAIRFGNFRSVSKRLCPVYLQ